MTFKTHGPRIINDIETWAITEGETDIWCLCPTKEKADFLCSLLNEFKDHRFYKQNFDNSKNYQSDFDRRFNESWQTSIPTCPSCYRPLNSPIGDCLNILHWQTWVYQDY